MDNQYSDKPKDVKIQLKGARHTQDRAGNDRSVLGMTTEQATALYNGLGAILEKDPQRGVNLDIHFTTPEYEGRTFDSGYFFVKEIGEPPGQGTGAPTKFAPKAPTGTAAVKGRVEAFKKAQG